MGKIFDRELAPSETVYDGKLLDPRHIRINPELNGRHEEPTTDDLEEDFLNPSIGQLAPVLITKDDDNAPLLLAGHRRWRAAMKITLAGKGPYAGVFKLRCQYYKGSPLECFILTVKENTSRRETLPIDDGYNVSRLRNNFGMSYEDIAMKVYSRILADGSPDVKWVQEREALSDLAAEAAEAVTGGRVKPSAVLELAKMSKTAQRNLLKSTEGKITAAIIKRATASANGTAPSTPAATSGTGTTSDAPSDAPRAGKSQTGGKWSNVTVCAKLQEWIDMNLPPHIARMDAENAIRTVLGQIQNEIQCGK